MALSITRRWQEAPTAFRVMDEATLKQVVDDVANAVQAAVLVATRLKARLREDAEAAETLHQALRRATRALQRLQPK